MSSPPFEKETEGADQSGECRRGRRALWKDGVREKQHPVLSLQKAGLNQSRQVPRRRASTGFT